MKFSGNIGFLSTEEVSPGVWGEVILEKPYYGDVLKKSIRISEASDKLNDDVTPNHQISVVINRYIIEHLGYLRYVRWKNVKWKILSFDIANPRIILTVGGVYDGPEPVRIAVSTGSIFGE